MESIPIEPSLFLSNQQQSSPKLLPLQHSSPWTGILHNHYNRDIQWLLWPTLVLMLYYPKKNLLSSVRTMRPFILYIRITSLSQSQCQQWHTVDTSTVPSGNSRRVSHWGSIFSGQSRQPTITNCGTYTWYSGLFISEPSYLLREAPIIPVRTIH